jgi:ComF family protein
MMRLVDMLFPPRVDEIALRNVLIDDFLALVTPQIIPETRPETVVLLPFNSPSVRAAIHEAKYHGNVRAFKLLARVLAEYLRDADDIPRTSFIISVPLSKKRHKERGFNQVEEVARYALRSLGEERARAFTLESNLLDRMRETTSQVSLPRHDREENMRGAFRAIRPADPSYTYIVLDDVVTTGATLQAAVDALRGAGAEHIIPLALAH